MGEGMKDADHSMGNRQSTIDCMAKVVRALLVCQQLTIRVLASKADISVAAARRAVAGLHREGLIKRDATPSPTREHVYVWVGVED